MEYLIIIWFGFIIIGWIYNAVSKHIEEGNRKVRDALAQELLPEEERVKLKEEYEGKLVYIGYKQFNTEKFVDDVLKREAYRSRIKCPNCDNGFLSLREGKYGKFFGCSNYPKCHTTINAKDGKAQIKEIVNEEFVQDFKRAYS